MTHNVKLTNNSDKTLSLNLLNFFTMVTGVQSIVLTSGGGVHECQVDCNDADVHQRLFSYCIAQGIELGKNGLMFILSPIPPVIGE